jgi:hypothetical protein
LTQSSAKLVIPLVVAAFLADSHLIDDKLDFQLFSKYFSSAHNLCDILIAFAKTLSSRLEIRFVEQRECIIIMIKETKRVSANLRRTCHGEIKFRRSRLKHLFLISM